MRIVQVTDTHLFADPATRSLGVETDASLRVVLTAVADLDPAPDALLLTGDLGHDEKPESYERLAAFVAPLSCPIYWLPGNHDSPDTMRPALGERGPGSHELGEWRLITLSTHIPGIDSGRLGAEELGRLADSLGEAHSLGRPTLVALHHPPVPVESRWLDRLALEDSEAFFQVLDRVGAPRLVLAGHVHQEQMLVRAGVTILTTPSTCGQFAPDSPEFRQDEVPAGFRVLDLAADGSFSTRVVRVPGSGAIDEARLRWMREGGEAPTNDRHLEKPAS